MLTASRVVAIFALALPFGLGTLGAGPASGSPDLVDSNNNVAQANAGPLAQAHAGPYVGPEYETVTVTVTVAPGPAQPTITEPSPPPPTIIEPSPPPPEL